jgi:hypothetical protein
MSIYLSDEKITLTALFFLHPTRYTGRNQRNNNSHGFIPVCFLKAVEKWEIEE